MIIVREQDVFDHWEAQQIQAFLGFGGFKYSTPTFALNILVSVKPVGFQLACNIRNILFYRVQFHFVISRYFALELYPK